MPSAVAVLRLSAAVAAGVPQRMAPSARTAGVAAAGAAGQRARASASVLQRVSDPVSCMPQQLTGGRAMFGSVPADAGRFGSCPMPQSKGPTGSGTGGSSSSGSNGCRILRVFVADEPIAWRNAGFHVTDGKDVKLANTTITLVGREAGKGIVGWGITPTGIFRQPCKTSIDGLSTHIMLPPHDQTPTCWEPHPNGVTAADHVVAFTGSHELASMELTKALGFGPRATKVHGKSVYSFYRFEGPMFLELVQPENPEPLAPMLPTEGTKFVGLAFVSSDLDHIVNLLGIHGAGKIRNAVQTGRKIVTIRHKFFDISASIAVLTPHLKEDLTA